MVQKGIISFNRFISYLLLHIVIGTVLAIDNGLIIAEYIKTETIGSLVIVIESTTEQISLITCKNKDYTISW